MEQASAAPRNVSRAVVVKSEDLFFLTEPSGQVPCGNQDGFGLYFHDCRFLNGYEVQIGGTAPNPLGLTAARGSVAEFVLTNEALHQGGKGAVPQQTFGVRLERILDSENCALHDVFAITNYDVVEHALPLTLEFQSDFEDVFEIRGLHPKKIGRTRKPEWRNDVLVLRYDGADGVRRQLEIHADPQPERRSESGMEFDIRLKGGEQKQVRLALRIRESRERVGEPKCVPSKPREVADAIDRRSERWLAQIAEVHSDNASFNAVMGRSLRDLSILESRLDGLRYFSAGLPWYGALFGRDSITAALQMLAYESDIGEQTIRLLANHQGTTKDDRRDEEPGKILHELRRGELANLNEIPQTPYYGSVDATPLFLLLVGEHAQWSGNLNLFREVRENVDRALDWVDRSMDEDANGYLSYASKSSRGLGNQGWKDSGDSIMNSDGALATPPIALVEVQGYVYRAKLLIADLYARSGEDKRADQLRAQAAELKARFNRDFWLEDQKFYAMALQKGGRAADVVSSNPGQALWTGIVDDARAREVAAHLMAEDMFSGWGIRTLSHKEKRYNPIGYHLGTVWPHDNSFIAAGLRRYGFEAEAMQVLDAIVQAAGYFDHHRLPEVFAGFPRNQFAVPVRYPVACHPQAWAAGAVPLMTTALLGITAEALHGRLHIRRPQLPHGVNSLDFRRLRVGESEIDLRFHRTAGDRVEVNVTRQTGAIHVQIELEDRPKAA